MFESVSRFLRQTSDDDSVLLDPPKPAPPFRPRIGLALGGGSARGWAHIGVLRALEEAGLHVDVVAGTSIGAIVGGCWISGRLAELEAFSRSVTKRRMLQLMDFSLTGRGLIGGNRLGSMLHEHLGDRRIEDLGTSFVTVATELGSGHEVWLSTGQMVEAIRASYALPGIFTPIQIGGRWLVDGALVNPVPVSVCRAFGARLVIAVTLAGENFGRGSVIHHDRLPNTMERTAETEAETDRTRQKSWLRTVVGTQTAGAPGIPGVMMEAFNIITDRITRARLAGDPPDLTVSPKLGRIGLFDFHRAGEAIDIGYEAARRQVAEIRELATALG